MRTRFYFYLTATCLLAGVLTGCGGGVGSGGGASALGGVVTGLSPGAK